MSKYKVKKKRIKNINYIKSVTVWVNDRYRGQSNCIVIYGIGKYYGLDNNTGDILIVAEVNGPGVETE